MSTILIKIGGEMARKLPVALLQQLKQLHGQHQIIIVHGAGSDITDAVAAAGIETERVDGLRVTPAPVLAIAQEIISQQVQPNLMSQLLMAGVPTAVLNGGVTTGLINAHKYGLVGEVAQIDVDALQTQLEANGTVLIGPLLPDAAGHLLNVNADDVAMAIAKQLNVQQLHFVTDVPGVLDASGSVVPLLNKSKVQALAQAAVITGGMRVKLSAGLAVAANHRTKVTIGNMIQPAGTTLV